MSQDEPGLDCGRCLRPRLLTRRHGAASIDRSIRLPHEARATIRRGRIGISSGRSGVLHLLSPRERPAEGRARRPDRRGRGNPPSPTRSCWPRDPGSSDGREEAGRVEHVVFPVKRAKRAGLRGEEGGGGLDLGRDRRAPGPGSELPVECPGRNGRCLRLSGAPGPRAGARPSRHGERIGWAGQVAHQGFDQRGELARIVPGSDEMRATSLRDRGRKKDQRQERCNGSRRREGQMPGRTRSRHSSGSGGRLPLPHWKGATYRGGEVALDQGR
jgi:hypothetical protein